MLKKTYSTLIDATQEKVWQILWSQESYSKWTKVFSEGSRAETDWQEGSSIRFLSAEGDGMDSIIAKKIDNKFMSFKHMGFVKNGALQPMDEATQKWSGSFENYTLTANNGQTELTVHMDVIEEYENYFDEKFPPALGEVKRLAEEG